MAIERRLTELVGPVGGKLHTAGRGTTRSRPTWRCSFVRRRTGTQALARRAHGGPRRPRRAAPGLADAGLHAPPARAARLPVAPPARVLLDVPPRPRALRLLPPLDRRRCRSARERSPASTGTRAGRRSRRSSASNSVARELARRRLQPRLRARLSSARPRSARCTCHGSGAEIVLWSSEEFGFVELGDSFSSGSSIMPQKKNPDAAELLRAKAPRVAGHLVALLGVLHGLPLAYNKDMQEDKEHLFDAVDTLEISSRPPTGMLRDRDFQPGAAREAAGDEFLAATEIADLLVRRGVPFREAHGAVAGSCGTRSTTGKRLSELELRGAARPFPTASTASITRCFPAARGWSRRSPRAGLHRVASGSRSKARARF